MSRLLNTTGTLLLLSVLVAAPVGAATEIGAVAAAEGAVEVRRANAGDWKALDLGAAIFHGDEIRTAERGRLKILFVDETVLDLAPTTALAIKDFATPSAKGGAKTVIGLSSGRIRPQLGDAYASAKASYEVETPTAVVRAEGTDFIVGYDAKGKSSEVFGIAGGVEVQGAIGLIGPSVKVAAGERTEVQEGKFPVPVEAVGAAAMADAQAGIEIIGTGRRDGLATDHAILRGELVRADEKPLASGAAAVAPRDGVSYLDIKAPGETLRDQLSPALRANTQPVLEYKYAAPDQPAGN